MRWLILRGLPLKERFAVVDNASIPALVPLLNPIRAGSEMCLLIVRARERHISYLPMGVDSEMSGAVR